MLHRIARFMWPLCALAMTISAGASALDIDKCDSTSKAEIQTVHAAMTKRVNATVARFTWLTEKQRDELKEKWSKLKIDCEDDRNKCSKDSVADDGLIITGFAHGGLGNTVNVCYYNLVEANLTLCSLVGNIWHEKGHADGMPKAFHHNNPAKHPEVLNDDVYRMGNAAVSECKASMFVGTADRALKGRALLALGASCSKESQCNSAKCKDGKCVCKRDSDCGSGRKCKEPVFGTPHCE